MLSLGLIFYILMLIWAVFGLLAYGGFGGAYIVHGSNILFFVLFLLLGWKVFGAPISR
jgi:hypothetical protein